METSEAQVRTSYALAKERYAALGVDTELALSQLTQLSVSIHCWQGDDVAGFEPGGTPLGGGLAVTGSYPGRPRDADELRQDLQWALARIPGRHRLNLHASYAETSGRQVDRNALQVEHFQNWIDWAREQKLGLDFNSTFFAHPLAADGMTLAHPSAERRQFWIEHAAASRRVAAAMGRSLGSACLHNVWIPDGSKDTPVDRRGPRVRLLESLDQIFAEAYAEDVLVDAVESKLFGIGSESYVVGSHEFYLGYASSRHKWLCLDAGHFHPHGIDCR
jgi:L-rhamnose isomerase